MRYLCEVLDEEMLIFLSQCGGKVGLSSCVSTVLITIPLLVVLVVSTVLITVHMCICIARFCVSRVTRVLRERCVS